MSRLSHSAMQAFDPSNGYPNDAHLQAALVDDIELGESLVNLLGGDPAQYDNTLGHLDFSLDPIVNYPAFAYTPHEAFNAENENTWAAFAPAKSALEGSQFQNSTNGTKRNATCTEEDGEQNSSGGKPRKRRKKARVICEREWEPQKPHIIQLYIAEGRKLEEVKDLMGKNFSFEATKKQFQDQLKKWELKKNAQGREKEAIIRKFLERQNESSKRPLRFFIRGRGSAFSED
ncbi:hypothetical protein BU23DRAFT_275514 [Bimuria novae-zelandiae CBS 107.79]|uniref:Clr5 domain-containing protein n=1 Tax=Bimuria novae-zelandiae CBS 107.79 TaxID=1447943 RepID=A0A6A5VMG5_9PLEO|nr:hypothetical protein BU23DRAFT_275514 [Bimuria novae-zelandiae CBS 107.79]